MSTPPRPPSLTKASIAGLTLAVVFNACAPGAEPEFTIEVSFPESLESEPLDGRILVILSTNDDDEPRFQARRGLNTQPLFGIDVDGLAPGEPAVFDSGVRGYPVESIDELPAGDYYVQAVLNRYTTFERADGHTMKAHMDQWEGQKWNRSPGNMLSEPTKVTIDPAAGGTVSIELSSKIPSIEPPEDTQYVKHIKFKSDILSDWWGHDIDLGAVVVLPPGFDEHPDARYPVAYLQGHFPRTFTGFREEPPGDDLEGRARDRAEGAYRFYQDWAAGNLPNFLIVLIQHPTPFYDDSYAVNSANNGPYGDALMQEFIPKVEEQFRAIGEPWARTVYGGSTGGWESLAWQIFYPDTFNGTWTFCPDPVDFHYFQMVNIYEDDNAFYPNSEWKTSAIRPWQRSTDDQVMMNQRDGSRIEAVLGTKGRSGDQMDIFMSVYGPVSDDGYPRLLYDKWTGEIDKGVVEYWRENYDLNHILQRDWETLGPKLVGKLNIYMGDMDTYFLEEATWGCPTDC